MLVINSCSNTNNPANTVRPLTPDEKHIVSSGNNFGLNLFQEVNREEGDKNIVLSPLSVSMALGMTVNGAAGSTRDSMLNTLEMLGISIDQVNSSYQSLINLLLNMDSKVQFELANSIWYRNTWVFEQSFFDVCNKYFNSQVTGLNFDDPSAKNTINNWVNTQTKGKIPDIIDAIDPTSIMFLINTIYFKGNWTYKFDTTLTKDLPFYLLDGTSQTCKMMSQLAYLSYSRTQDFDVVDIPYGSKNFSMTIFLPSSNNNINDFINGMTQDNYNQWLLNFKTDSVNIFIPKYKVEYKIKLNDALINMGMGIAFGDYANFYNMTKVPGTYIGEVLHKTYVLVDEAGTEAAAVTSVDIRNESMAPGGHITIRLDRPFVFVIREKSSGTIVFIGKIVEPLN
ncbi:MAG: serpin family protein [FCB group bacterium]|jgi:serpin B